MHAAWAVLAAFSFRARLHDLREAWPLTLLGLVLLVAAAVLVSRRGSAIRLVAFVVAAMFWLAVDGNLDGPTLVRVVRRHGVTLGDLLPLALALASGGLAVHRRRGAVRSTAPRAR
jgi:hypothetical protein